MRLPLTNSTISPVNGKPPNDLNILLKDFAHYTDSIIRTSKLKFRRDLLEERAEKQDRLKDRWQKYSQSFVALTEDHDRESEKAAALTESSTRKIKQNEEAQERAVQKLLKSLLAMTSGLVPRPEEEFNITRDIEGLKANIRDTNASLDKVKYDLISKGTMIEYESKVANLMVNLNKLQISSSEHEQRFVAKSEMSMLADKVDALERRMEESEKNYRSNESVIASQKDTIIALNEDLAAQKDTIIALNEDLAAQKVILEGLNAQVVGNAVKKEEGLLDYVKHEAEKIQDFGKTFENFHSDLKDSRKRLQELETSIVTLTDRESHPDPAIVKCNTQIQNINERLQGFECSISAIKTRELSTMPTTSLASINQDALEKRQNDLEEQLSSVKAQIKSMDEQQDMKDDLVAKEVERLDIKLLRLEKMMEELIEETSGLQSQVASKISPPSPPPQSGGNWKPEESFRLKVEELESSLASFKESSTERADSMEVLVESQQQRFDHLSTEHLAAGIIHQMRSLYPPHPGNVQSDLNQLNRKQQQLEINYFNLWNESKKLIERLESQASGMTAFQNKIMGDLETKHQELTRNQESMEPREVDIKLSNLHKAFQDLERRLIELSRASTEALGSIQRQHMEQTKVSLAKQQSLETVYTKLRAEIEASIEVSKHKHKQDLDALRNEHKNNISSLKTDMKAAQNELETLRDRIVNELASVHGEISVLRKVANITNGTSEENSQESKPQIQSHAGADNTDSSAPIIASSRKVSANRQTPSDRGKKRMKPTYYSDDTYSSGSDDAPLTRRSERNKGRVRSGRLRRRSHSDGHEHR